MIDRLKLSEIFKTEYSNLIAVLSNYYGIKDLQLAEDIVSETFVKAMKSWSHKGIPQYPQAWLRKVAQNLYFEDHRRQNTFNDKVSPTIAPESEAYYKKLQARVEIFLLLTRCLDGTQIFNTNLLINYFFLVTYSCGQSIISGFPL